MYQAHFKLDKRLFEDGVAADAAVFRSRQHDHLIEQFKLALSSSTSIVLLRGPAGVGKSTLTSTALRAASTRLALAWLNSTPSNAAELLELMLADFGVNAARASRIERLQLWRQFQAEMAATESRLFVVVERTEDLPVEVLHTLDSLTAADAAGHPGANVVLLGHHGLEAHLTAPVLDSFRQRIRLRAELKPFSEAELQDYLRHQVACAGGHFDRLFAPGTVATLQRYSRGVARLCNNLCETALTIAATRAQTLLTPQIVTEAAVEWLGLVEVSAPAAQAAPLPSAAIAVSNVPVQTPVAPTIAISTPVFTPAPVAAPIPVARATVAPPVQAAPVVAPIVTARPVAPTAVVAPPPFVAPAPIVSPAPAPAPVAVRAPQPPPPPPPKPAVAVAPPAPAAAPPPALEIEFDGGETDVRDVEIVDFPVLTDAVEASEPPVAKRPSAPPPVTVAAAVTPSPAAPRPVASPAPTPPRTAPPAPPAAPAAPAPTRRVEPAYVAPKGPPPAVKPPPPAATAPAAKPAAPPPPKPAAPPPAAASAPTPRPPPRPEPAPAQDEDDLARQTQTMRAIAEAKSIDDVSDTMAETLFGDAELDLMSAALATAASMADEDDAAAAAPPKAAAPTAPKPPPTPKPAPAAKPAAAKPAPAKPASSDDDLIELLGLSDAPLELIDDSAQSPADKKNAGRR